MHISAGSVTAVSEGSLSIPLIDFSSILHPTTEDQKLACCKEILTGFKTAGFLYLKNHGISDSEIATAFKQSAHFFSRSQNQKDGLEWTNPASNRGYMRMGREKVTDITDEGDARELRESNPDLKETMDLGRESEAGFPNPWPDRYDTGTDDSGAEFRREVLRFWELCNGLNQRVMRCLAVGMGYEERFFDEFTSGGDNTLRLLHYPQVGMEVFKGKGEQMRAGAHCDFGTITLLFQDNCGGLEVRSPTGAFVPATPIAGTIVVNAGDLLARWSNGLIKSTMHRVVQPPIPETAKFCPERFSMAYFCNPNFDKVIAALPGTFDELNNPQKHPPIKSGDYLVERLRVTVASS